MKRYHKDVYIPEAGKRSLEALTDVLNTLKWTYSKHVLDNLKYRSINMEAILLFIKNTRLQAKDIFEYYIDDKSIIYKVCFRLSFASGTDIILVLSNMKNIVTLYMNEKNDMHYTLNKSLYVKN
jgi:hypothetical protein